MMKTYGILDIFFFSTLCMCVHVDKGKLYWIDRKD